MRFFVLGPLEIRLGEAPAAIRSGRPRALLHMLLLHRRAVLPVELVADRIWGEEAPLDAANAVHQLVSYLRRTLGSEGRPLIVTTPTGYRLDVDDDDVDAWRFERLVQSAMHALADGSHGGAVAGLADADAALQLWRGEPFAESAEQDWATGAVARLRDTYLQAQESRLDALMVIGRHREVVLQAQSLTAAYPLREQFHWHWAMALYRSGRQSEALEVLRSVRQLLADELGIDPGRPLQELAEQILRQDPVLDWTPPAGAPPDDIAVGAGSPEPSAAVLAIPAPEPHVFPHVAPLFGRGRDLETTRPMLRAGRILTITGPGGVGKTHLATTLVSEQTGTATWFVDLSDVEQDEHVAATVADRLGLVGQFPHDPADRVVEALAPLRGQLVLDTCEHVPDGVATLLTRLRDAAPGLQLLVTSRRPIGVPGEVVHQLAPLGTPDAGSDQVPALLENASVQLFRERARRVQADFDLTQDNAQDVAGIVCAVDGLPVAIELAAAQVDVLSPATIRARLGDQTTSLVASSPAIPPRQRSLRAAIDSSVVLLSADEQALFLALSVFPGRFDLGAAGTIGGCGDSDAFPLLASLVRQSLVVRHGKTHYRLLSPIRAYAIELARGGSQFAEARRRHTDWVAAAAEAESESSRGADQELALDRLRQLLPDARSALQWSLDTGYVAGAARISVAFSWVWTLQGLADEGIGWLSSVRALCEANHELSDTRVRATVLRSLGLLANPVGRLTLARDVCTESVALSTEIGDDAGAAAALLTLGVAQWALGDLEEAGLSHDRAADLAAATPGAWSHTAAHVLRARTALDAGEADAERRIELAVEVAQDSNERQLLGLALACHARHLHLRGQHDRAEIVATEALRLWRLISYREGEMSALNLLGRALGARGDTDRAEESCWQALSIARMARHPGAMCESVESLALVAAAAGRREHAYLLLSVAARERRRLGAPVPRADAASLSAAQADLVTALGSAVPLVEARAELMRFEDLVVQLIDDFRPSAVLTPADA